MASSYNRRVLTKATINPEDEIVISGISGRFPNSDNMHDFAHNLYNKVDMVDDDEKRWRHTNPEIPKRFGKVNRLEKFDAFFFSVHHRQANTMDPQCRMLLGNRGVKICFRKFRIEDFFLKKVFNRFEITKKKV